MGKSKYDTHIKPHLERIKTWVELGASEKEVARKLNLAMSTFALYLKRGREGEQPYAELSECFTEACIIPDDNVEAALYHSAQGYTIPVKKTFKVRHIEYDEHTGRKINEWDELVKDWDEVHVPANVEAQKFWLINRRPDKWKTRPEESASPADDGTQGVIMMPEVPADDG